ncbi:MAG: glycosyltransferase family 4 protein [Alphaproteobacteria bacterium]|nr:glycosyltransferase family 4 protein [Alphaproteobacteria bacterium]
MRVALLADAITPPLTGIGRYAWELARRLSDPAHAIRLSPLTLAGWRDLGALEAGLSGVSAGGLARRVAGVAWAAPAVEAARRFAYGRWLRPLRGRRDVVLHGPNYHAPASDLPTVITLHDLSTVLFPETHPAERVKRVDIMLEVARRRDFDIITDAAVTADDIVRVVGAPRERVHVVGLGVGRPFSPSDPLAAAATMAKYGLTAGAYCLSVGAIEPRKNLSRLLAAYAALPAALRSAHPLAVAGAKGWRDQGLLRDLELARRDGWLRPLGYVPLEDLPDLYSAARLCAYVSLYEGFGLPVAEAMACGAPVLASTASSLPEVAGGAAMLVDPTDVAAITRCLERALTDAAWRAEASRRGLARAQELSWDRTAANTARVYRAVLARS